jgi:predicted flap endonuclease-1-like 5' DNA nuclease/ribosomal protein S6
MNINNTQGSQDGVYAPEPRVYELGYHILPTVDEGNVIKERDALVAIITKLKGIVISEETPGLVDLAYTMDKTIENKRNIFSQAYFGWIKFELTPVAAGILDLKVESMESVLRYMIIKTVRENTIFSPEPYRLAKGTLDNTFEDESGNDETDTNESEDDTSEEKEVKEVAEEIVADDLTKIEGIGPKIAEIFVAAGIKTFADVSSSKIDDLRALLEENKLSSHDPKTWSKQATLAKNEKWDELATLQDELKGGK